MHSRASNPPLAIGTQFLQVISWNFVASGIVFTCSAVFQGLGNTVPAVLSSASRLVSFRPARAMACLVAAISADSGLVCVGGERHAAGCLESLAGARRISATLAGPAGIGARIRLGAARGVTRFEFDDDL